MIKSTTVVILVLVLFSQPGWCLTDNEKLNEIWYGVFAQNRLPRPQYFLKCFDDESAGRIVKLAKQIIPQLAKVVPPVRKIKEEVLEFISHMDGGLIWCLGYCYEIQELGWAMGIFAGSSPQEILHEFEVYYALHEPKTHRLLVHLNQLLEQEKYYDMGFLGSIFAHEVVDGKNALHELAHKVKDLTQNLLSVGSD